MWYLYHEQTRCSRTCYCLCASPSYCGTSTRACLRHWLLYHTRDHELQPERSDPGSFSVVCDLSWVEFMGFSDTALAVCSLVLLASALCVTPLAVVRTLVARTWHENRSINVTLLNLLYECQNFVRDAGPVVALYHSSYVVNRKAEAVLSHTCRR